MKPFYATAIMLAILVGGVLPQTTKVFVLGTAQDAGAPQMGCMSKFCRKAWKDPGLRKKVSSIALYDGSTGGRWIFDATPDLPYQFQLLKELTRDSSNRLDGIFLTHAHIGHYTGLMYLGRESLNSKGTSVYAMPRMKELLADNAPWSQLVTLGNIKLKAIRDGGRVELTESLRVEVFTVPHRDEFSETAGFRIVSGKRSLAFIPDIDKWAKWSKSLEALVAENDFLLLDGTFYADGEIPRPISEVPHPFVLETAALLESLPADQKKKVYFIHFNHSNPLIQGDKAKIKELSDLGFSLAKEGMQIELR